MVWVKLRTNVAWLTADECSRVFARGKGKVRMLVNAVQPDFNVNPLANPPLS